MPPVFLAADAAAWTRFGAVVVGGLLLAQIVGWLVLRVERSRGDVRGALVVGRLFRLVLVALTVIYALAQVGVRIGPLVAAAGVGGIALAIAVRSILENLLAGTLLLLRRPFRQGDEIESGDFEGVVEDVNLRTVVLRTYDGRRVLLPNGGVLNAAIVNHTAFPSRRSAVEVGVSYDTDLEHAARTSIAAVRTVEGVHEDPPPEAYATGFGESAMTLCVRFWHDSVMAQEWRVRHEVVVALKAALDEQGIEIPFDQITVRLGLEGQQDTAVPVRIA